MAYSLNPHKNKLKVVVVCNGESVLIHELGNIIDSMDIVIRMGDFKIRGYENSVGTKTNIIINRINQTPDLTYATEDTQYWSPHQIEKEELLHPLQLTKEEIVEAQKITKTTSPTTGCIAYFLARKFIPNMTTLYFHGLDFLNGGHYWNPKHTHDMSHEPVSERIWFDRLFASGKAHRLTTYR